MIQPYAPRMWHSVFQRGWRRTSRVWLAFQYITWKYVKRRGISIVPSGRGIVSVVFTGSRI